MEELNLEEVSGGKAFRKNKHKYKVNEVVSFIKNCKKNRCVVVALTFDGENPTYSLTTSDSETFVNVPENSINIRIR